ncbi:MAG TPA: 6-phosphofructokinase [bacterium]
MKRKIGILTGGGDTQPLNAVLFFLRIFLEKAGFGFIGFVKGWEGVLENRFVDLIGLPDFGCIGGTILKSSRVNLDDRDGFMRANANLKATGIDALVVIGGDDTLSNVYGIETVPCVGIAKTIDNDVGFLQVDNGTIQSVNYFTLGYPTAADKIARFVSLEEGIRTTAYSHERIMVIESMGMQAGWLAMASAFGRPDMVVIPEFPLDYQRFLVKLKEIYSRRRHAVVVVAEGARLHDGSPFRSDSSAADAFGNPKFGGAGEALRDMVKHDLTSFMDVRNVNSVNPSYWYRSGFPHALDRLAAERMAERIFGLVEKGTLSGHHFVSVDFQNGSWLANDHPFLDFPQTTRGRFPKRTLDKAFYNTDTFSATELWTEYLSRIVAFRSADTDYGTWIQERT